MAIFSAQRTLTITPEIYQAIVTICRLWDALPSRDLRDKVVNDFNYTFQPTPLWNAQDIAFVMNLVKDPHYGPQLAAGNGRWPPVQVHRNTFGDEPAIPALAAGRRPSRALAGAGDEADRMSVDGGGSGAGGGERGRQASMQFGHMHFRGRYIRVPASPFAYNPQELSNLTGAVQSACQPYYFRAPPAYKPPYELDARPRRPGCEAAPGRSERREERHGGNNGHNRNNNVNGGRGQGRNGNGNGNGRNNGHNGQRQRQYSQFAS